MLDKASTAHAGWVLFWDKGQAQPLALSTSANPKLSC